MAIGFLGLLLINTVLFVAGSILQHQLAKAPDVKPGEPQFPTVDASKKLPVLFGTYRLTLNVFSLGKMYADPISIRQNTSLITYHTPTVAFAYHWWLMGWLCYGPISAILEVIFEGNKPLTQYGNGKYNSGTITRVISTPAGFVSYEEPVYITGAGITGTDSWMEGGKDGYNLDLYAPDLFGGVDPKTGSGQGGVVGRIRVYNGNGEHDTNAEMQAINVAGIGPGHALYPYTEPAYPDWAYVVFENLYMGTQPQCPQIEFVAARAPVFKFGLGNPFIGLEVAKYGLSDYTYRYGGVNPAALIAEILLNDEWGKGYPRDLVDMGILAAMYDMFQPDVGGDGFHLCGVIDGDMSAEDALAEVMRHLDAVMYLSPVTGKISFMLLRGKDDVFGYGAVTDLPLISPDNASNLTWGKASQRPNINEVVVEFADVEKDFLKNAVKAQNTAAIQAAGRINTETVQYMWVTGKTWAAKLAQRDLRTISQDFAQGDVEMNREGMKLHVGQWVRLTWPEYNLTDVPCRVGSIDPGSLKDGKVKISIVEDYWSTEAPSYALIPPPAPIQNLQPYRSPTVDAVTLLNTMTNVVEGVIVYDPDGHVTSVEFSQNGAWFAPIAAPGPYVFTIAKLTNNTQTVCYRVNYTGPDGSAQTIQGCFDPIPTITGLMAPTLSYSYSGTDVIIDSNLPIGASGIKFAYGTNTPPTDIAVIGATEDTVPPYQLTLPIPAAPDSLYVRAAAHDGVTGTDSAISQLTIRSAPASTALATIPPSAQFPFGNGVIMSLANSVIPVGPAFKGAVLTWKARFLNAAKAQVTGTAVFSVKKVLESSGALVDMVGGFLNLSGVSEGGGTVAGWADTGFLPNDEILVTLESISNPNGAVSLLFTLSLQQVP